MCTMKCQKCRRFFRWTTLVGSLFVGGLLAYPSYEEHQISLFVWVVATTGMFVVLFFPSQWFSWSLGRLVSQGRELPDVRDIAQNALGRAFLFTLFMSVWFIGGPGLARVVGLKSLYSEAPPRAEKIFNEIFNWSWTHTAVFGVIVALMTVRQTWVGRSKARARILWPVGDK